MTTAIIGTGGIGSAISRQLAAGDETLQLSSADKQSARTLAEAIGGAAVIALDNRSVVQGADAVILALRFSVLNAVIDEIADALGDKTLVFRATQSASTNKVRSCGSCRKGKHLARLLPGGCRQGHA
jgi:predicted dinucleotide-binding enzyme